MEGDGEEIGKRDSAWGDDTVGEVEELHRSVDEGEAQGHKGVDAAGDEAVNYELLKHRVPLEQSCQGPLNIFG